MYMFNPFYFHGKSSENVLRVVDIVHMSKLCVLSTQTHTYIWE